MLEKRIMCVSTWHFTVSQAIKHRRSLKAIARQEANQCKAIACVSPDKLQAQGFDVLVLDFDGVLASHGETHVSKSIALWVSNAVKCFGPSHVFLLSNASSKRQTKIIEALPGVTIIRAKPKPFPEGLHQIQQKTKADPLSIVLIDDRLLTGGLSAVIAGTGFLLVQKPLKDYHKRFWIEVFFDSLRFIERFIFRFYF